jgi:hypothetical protein
MRRVATSRVAVDPSSHASRGSSTPSADTIYLNDTVEHLRRKYSEAGLCAQRQPVGETRFCSVLFAACLHFARAKGGCDAVSLDMEEGIKRLKDIAAMLKGRATGAGQHKQLLQGLTDVPGQLDELLNHMVKDLQPLVPGALARPEGAEWAYSA